MSSRSQKLLALAKNPNFTTTYSSKQISNELSKVPVTNITVLPNYIKSFSDSVNTKTSDLQTKDNLQGL